MKTKISCTCVADLDSILEEIREEWSDSDIVELIIDLAYCVESEKTFLKMKKKIAELQKENGFETIND